MSKSLSLNPIRRTDETTDTSCLIYTYKYCYHACHNTYTRLALLNTLTSGHVERRDCSPMRCWRVEHFYVFLHDARHMRLSVGVIHLGRGHTILTSRELMWCYECSWGYLTLLNSGAHSHFCQLCLRHVIWRGALVGSRASTSLKFLLSHTFRETWRTCK
jgi:hypothetical protein